MFRIASLLALVAIVLMACASGDSAATGPGGTRLYRISNAEAGRIPQRMVESVNTLRAASAAGPLTLNPQLTQAAAVHSRDMSVQNRPWDFGSDGSSPLDRVRRAGYAGQFVGENVAETYETELQTLTAWMQDRPDTRAVILDPKAREMGFAWHQEANGKIWWTLVTGR